MNLIKFFHIHLSYEETTYNLIIFAACGGSGSDSPTEPSPSTTSASTNQETTEETQAQNSTEEQGTIDTPAVITSNLKNIQMALLLGYPMKKLSV